MKVIDNTQSQTAMRFIGFCEKHELCPHEAMDLLLDLAAGKSIPVPMVAKEVVTKPVPKRKYKKRHALHAILKG